MGQLRTLGLANVRNIETAEDLPRKWVEFLIHITGDLLDGSIEYLCFIEAMQVKGTTLYFFNASLELQGRDCLGGPSLFLLPLTFFHESPTSFLDLTRSGVDSTNIDPPGSKPEVDLTSPILSVVG